MNELKDLCDRMVADAPPMRDGAAVLAAARRSAARRRAGAGAVAAVVVAAAAALTLQATIHSGRPQRGPAAVASATPLSHEARIAYQRTMAELLAAAVPAGYTTATIVWAQAVTAPVRAEPPDVYLGTAGAGVDVSDGHGHGMLTAAYWPDGGPARPVACADRSPAARCEPVVVGRVTVDVVTWTDEAGQHVEAVRRVAGGYVRVVAVQAVVSYPAGASGPVVGPGLATFPFTAQRIAGLAADPRMLPPA